MFYLQLIKYMNNNKIYNLYDFSCNNILYLTDSDLATIKDYENNVKVIFIMFCIKHYTCTVLSFNGALVVIQNVHTLC